MGAEKVFFVSPTGKTSMGHIHLAQINRSLTRKYTVGVLMDRRRARLRPAQTLIHLLRGFSHQIRPCVCVVRRIDIVVLHVIDLWPDSNRNKYYPSLEEVSAFFILHAPSARDRRQRGLLVDFTLVLISCQSSSSSSMAMIIDYDVTLDTSMHIGYICFGVQRTHTQATSGVRKRERYDIDW